MTRRVTAGPPKNLAGCDGLINDLEQNVFYQMCGLPPRIGLNEILEIMFEHNVVDTLKRAYPMVLPGNRSTWWATSVEQFGNLRCRVEINIGAANMLPPEHALVAWQNNTVTNMLWKEIEHAHQVHRDFEVIREVVTWFNTNATLGAARHYCPWLAAVMPAGHAFHDMGGKTFYEPRIGVGPIAPSVRAAATIMGLALMAPERTAQRLTNFKVNFYGMRSSANGSQPSEQYTSASFGFA